MGNTAWQANSAWEVVASSPGSATHFLPNPFTHTYLDDFYSDLLNGCQWEQPVSPFAHKPINRKAVWYVKSPCTCPYKYSGITFAPSDFPPWLSEQLNYIFDIAGIA